jgi:hypothetical protein
LLKGAASTFAIVAAAAGAGAPRTAVLVVGLSVLGGSGILQAARASNTINLASAATEGLPALHAGHSTTTWQMKATFNTFGAVVAIGLLPLIAYLLADEIAFPAIVAGGLFFGFGTLSDWRAPGERWRSGLRICLLGLSVGFVAYAVGHGIRSLIGAPWQ